MFLRTILTSWLIVACALGVQATTYISQHIEQDTKWLQANSPYIITNDLAILKGATLSIEAGVKVFFSRETKLVVAGNLVAVGNKRQKITFSGLNGGDWNGFIFTKEGQDFEQQTNEGCQFEYSVFEGTGESPAQLIRTKGCDLSIKNCEVKNCYTAIQTERQAEIWATNSLFEDCNRVFNIRNTSKATIQQNEMNNCNSIMLGGTTTFSNNKLNKFSGRGRHSGVVVWMLGGGVVNIYNNEFSNFEKNAIKLYKMTRRSSFFVKSNNFKNNTTNLELAASYYNKGTSVIEQNNFHNCKKYHIVVATSHADKDMQVLEVGTNYWGKISDDDLRKMILDYNTDEQIVGRVEYSKKLKKSISF